MHKILLDTDDKKLNERQVLRAINNSPISRKNMSFNFIKSGSEYWCLFSTSKEELELLPIELQDTAITYKKLEARTLS